MTDNVLHKDGKDYKHERQRHRTRRKEIINVKGKTPNWDCKDYKRERQRYCTRIAKTINMKGKDTEQGGKRL